MHNSPSCRRRRRVAAVVIAAAATLVGATAASAMIAGATARWSFDEASGPTALDSVGDLDGTISGASRIASGHVGGALAFDGTDRVTIPDSAVLRTLTIGVALWVRGDPENPPADGSVIVEKGDRDCDGGAYGLYVDGDHVEFRIRDREVGAMHSVSIGDSGAFPTLWDGAWHFVSMSAATGEWATMSLEAFGWTFHRSTRGIEHDGLDVTSLALGGPADVSCGGAGFVGDLDEVTIVDRRLTPQERELEDPPGTLAVDIESVDPDEPWESGTLHVAIDPLPVRAGSITTYLTLDGTETTAGTKLLDTYLKLTTDGEFDTSFTSFHAGSGTLRVRYTTSGGTWAEDTALVTIPRGPSSASGGQVGTPIAGEAFEVSTYVASRRPPYASGTIELWELVEGGNDTKAGSATVPEDGNTGPGAGVFTLPGRAAGTYTFEARYLGNPDVEPSTSDPFEVIVLPALDVGTVAIEDGAATTDDPEVTVATPASGAIALQVARGIDGPTEQDPPLPWSATVHTWLTSPHLGDDSDGERSIWIRFADSANRWGAWHTDSIVLDRGLPRGTVTINAGAPSTTSKAVTLTIGGGVEPSAYSQVQASNDRVGWSPIDPTKPVPWTMGGEGKRTVFVRWVDPDGRQSAPSTDTILVDLSGPVIGTIKASPKLGRTPGKTTGTVLRWSATDLTGIDRFDVYLAANAGSPVRILADSRATSITKTLTFGTKYRVLVKATDKLGHRTSRWGPWFIPSGYQESSSRIAYGGSWGSSSAVAYWGDRTRYARRTGATATFTAKARSIAWVAPLGPSRGSAKVYVDGVYVKTVSLYASSSRAPRVVFVAIWSTAGTHAVKVKVVGTAGHPRIDVDGFIAIRPG